MKLVRPPWNIERIVRLQRNEDRAAAALGDQVEAVVEELAEERHPRIVGCRKPIVGRHVGEEHQVRRIRVTVVIDPEGAVVRTHRRERGRIAGGLISDQVRDDARICVGHIPRFSVVGVGDDRGIRTKRHGIVVRVIEIRRLEKVLERLVGSAPVLASGKEIVVGPVNGSQPIGQEGIVDQIGERCSVGVCLRNFDLLQDKFKIVFDKLNH